GPFLPHPATPLGDAPAGSGSLTLKALAVARILLKRTHLPATTALEVQNINNRENAFYTGANVIMRKVQAAKYRRLYEIYPKPPVAEKDLMQERAEIESYIQKIGRQVADDKGDAIAF
ncbi:MAG TPA: [FeFe] hydrogenase H-cluster radical SAM maturase HydE, partial [Clostridiales bacterium]|nr:[FeFe] hydrogenase H-cluster radical SAM maturase HydE [Clostridiales bacterium]